MTGWVTFFNHLRDCRSSQFAKAANKLIKVDKLGKVIEDLQNLKGKVRERFGCLIEDRSKSIAVRDPNHGLENLVYMFLNPVRAGIVKHPKDYEHSNYNMYATGIAMEGFSFHPEYLELGNNLDDAAWVFNSMIEEAIIEIMKSFEKLELQGLFKREAFSSNIKTAILFVKNFFHLKLWNQNFA